MLLGNGDGTFNSRTDYATGAYSHSIVTADFNGDGKIDLATANEDQTPPLCCWVTRSTSMPSGRWRRTPGNGIVAVRG